MSTIARTLSPSDRRWTAVVIRPAVSADTATLRQLAHLDSARPLRGEVVMAEQGGAPVAAISLSDGRLIADPFTSTLDVAELLHIRAAQLRETA